MCQGMDSEVSAYTQVTYSERCGNAMFIVSMKPNVKKIFLFLLFGTAIGVSFYLLFQGSLVTEAAKKSAAVLTARSNEERITYLKTYGWEVGSEPLEISEVAIPVEFGKVYQEYNKIQKKQGFDLSDYAGRKVRRYTYEVTNYPDYPEDIRANLLVCEGVIIGGDICSIRLDGFMHGFARPKSS